MRATASALARANIALNAQAQNALALLKMSAPEVRAEIARRLGDNPFLEEDADFADGGDYAVYSSSSYSSAAADAGIETAAQAPDLREHLRLQARGANLDDDAKRALFALIEMVDEDGFLRADAADMKAAFAAAPAAADALAQARAALQEMEPAGVGAADVRECLLLQLNAAAQSADVKQKEVIAAARNIVKEHFDDLAARRFARLPRRLRADALALIQSLAPRPGARFAKADEGAAIPDIVFVKKRGLWRATPGPGLRAGVRLTGGAGGIKLNAALARRRTGARAFIRHLAWRERTVLGAARIIADSQVAFLESGDAARLIPLPMREIAARIKVSTATMSAALAGKTALTPRGIFALKYLCAREARGGVAAAAMRAAVREIISCEDGEKPLSDDQIAAALRGRGFALARRTAAAHRTALGVLPARLRRRL